MNDVKRKNVLYRLKPDSRLPYDSIDTITYDGTQLNSVTLNNSYNQLVDNDLFISHSIGSLAQHQVGPVQTNYDKMDEYQMGTKMWDNQANSVLSILHKVPVSIEDSISRVDGITDPVKHIFMYGSQLFVVTDRSGKNLYAPTNVLGTTFSLVDLGVDSYHINNYHIYSNGLLFATTDGVKHLVRQYNGGSDQFEYVLSSFSTADTATSLPDDDDNVQAVFFNRETGLLYVSTLSSVYSTRFTAQLGPKNVLMFYKCLVRNQTAEGDLVDATDVVANSIDSMYLSKYTFDNATLLLTNDGLYSTIAETESTLVTGKLLDGKNCYTTFVVGDIALVGCADGIYNLDGTPIVVKDNQGNATGLTNVAAFASNSGQLFVGSGNSAYAGTLVGNVFTITKTYSTKAPAKIIKIFIYSSKIGPAMYCFPIVLMDNGTLMLLQPADEPIITTPVSDLTFSTSATDAVMNTIAKTLYYVEGGQLKLKIIDGISDLVDWSTAKLVKNDMITLTSNETILKSIDSIAVTNKRLVNMYTGIECGLAGTIIDACKVFQRSDVSYLALVKNGSTYQIILINSALAAIKRVTIDNTNIGSSKIAYMPVASFVLIYSGGDSCLFASLDDILNSNEITFSSSSVIGASGLDFFASDSANVIGHAGSSTYEFSPIKTLEQFSCNIPKNIRSVQRDDWLALYNQNMISVAYLPTGVATSISYNDISSVQLNSSNGHIQLDVITNTSSIYSCLLNSSSLQDDVSQIFNDGKIYESSENTIIGYCPTFALYSDCIFGSNGISSLEPSESTLSQNENLTNTTSIIHGIPVSGDFIHYSLLDADAVLYNDRLYVRTPTTPINLTQSTVIDITELNDLSEVADNVKDFCSLYTAVLNSITDVGSDSVTGAANGIIYLTNDNKLYYVNASSPNTKRSIDGITFESKIPQGIDSIYSDSDGGIVLGVTLQSGDNYCVEQYKISFDADGNVLASDPSTISLSSNPINDKAWFGFRPEVMFYKSGTGIIMISNSEVTYYDATISDLSTTSEPRIIEQYAIGYTEIEEVDPWYSDDDDSEEDEDEDEDDEDEYISNLTFTKLRGDLYKNSDGQLYCINGSQYALLAENDSLEADEAEPGVVLRYPIDDYDYDFIDEDNDEYESNISAIDSISEFGCEALIETVTIGTSISRILPGNIIIGSNGSAYEFTTDLAITQLFALSDSNISQVICLDPTIVIAKKTDDTIIVIYSDRSLIYTLEVVTATFDSQGKITKTAFSAKQMTHFNNSVIFDCDHTIRQLTYATIVDAVQRDKYERTTEQQSIAAHKAWEEQLADAEEKDKAAIEKLEPTIYQRQDVYINATSLTNVNGSSLVPDSYSYAVPISQTYRDNLNSVLGVRPDSSGNMPASTALIQIYYITSDNQLKCESANYVGVTHQKIDDLTVTQVYFSYIQGRVVGTSNVPHILGVMGDGRIYDITTRSVISESLGGKKLVYSGDNYYILNAEGSTVAIALDYPDVANLINIKCDVTPAPEKIISIESLGFSDVFVCSKGIFSIDTDTKFSFTATEYPLDDITADEIFSYGADDVIYRNGNGLSSFTLYDASHTAIDIQTDDGQLPDINAIHTVNDRVSNTYKFVVTKSGDDPTQLYYGKDFSSLVRYPDTRILTDDATINGIFSLLNRLYINTNKGIYYCDGYRDVTQFVRLDGQLSRTTADGTNGYATCYTSTKIDPTQTLVTTNGGLYRVYSNEGQIIGKKLTVDQSDSYPVTKVDAGTASAHDSGFVCFYPVASLKNDGKGGSYTDFSIRTSKNGKRWTKFMSLSAIADSIHGLSGFAAYDDGKYYIGTDNGVYLAKETYKVVNDIKKMTPDKLRSLYDGMGTSFSEIYSQALSQHEGSWHATGSIASQLNDLMSRDCEGANLHAFVGNDTSTFDRDIVETIEFGKTSDGRIAVTVSNGVLNVVNDEKVNKSETIICDYIIKRSATKFTEIYLYVPTTHTYYFSKPKGSAKYDQRRQSFVRPNLAGICDISLNGNPDQEFTTIQVRINDSGLTSQLQLTDVQADGNSLPLKVYRDPTDYTEDGDVANMYRSLILPTVYRGISDGAYQFACYGTDAQSLKLVFRSR